MSKEKRKSAASAVVATVIVAIAAVAAIVVFIMMSKNSEPEQSSPNNSAAAGFKPTQEFADECGAKAQELVAGNYRIVRLFVSEGLAHRDEPYGNRPEDGLYTVESDEYETFEQIESLVKSVFTEEEANRILTNMPSDPAAQQGDTSAAESSSGDISRPEFIAVYGSRVEFVSDSSEASDNEDMTSSDENGGDADDEDGENDENDAESSNPNAPNYVYVKVNVLGINEYFKPYTDYKKPWGSISIKIAPLSETECNVTIYLGADKDVYLSSVEDTDILNTKMIKENGEWRLTELVY